MAPALPGPTLGGPRQVAGEARRQARPSAEDQPAGAELQLGGDRASAWRLLGGERIRQSEDENHVLMRSEHGGLDLVQRCREPEAAGTRGSGAKVLGVSVLFGAHRMAVVLLVCL